MHTFVPIGHDCLPTKILEKHNYPICNTFANLGIRDLKQFCLLVKSDGFDWFQKAYTEQVLIGRGVVCEKYRTRSIHDFDQSVSDKDAIDAVIEIRRDRFAQFLNLKNIVFVRFNYKKTSIKDSVLLNNTLKEFGRLCLVQDCHTRDFDYLRLDPPRWDRNIFDWPEDKLKSFEPQFITYLNEHFCNHSR